MNEKESQIDLLIGSLVENLISIDWLRCSTYSSVARGGGGRRGLEHPPLVSELCKIAPF